MSPSSLVRLALAYRVGGPTEGHGAVAAVVHGAAVLVLLPRADAGLGFGRIVVSGIEVTNMLVNLV